MKISASEIKQLDKRFRIQLINSLPGIKSANLIGSVDSDGIENLSIVSSVIHLGSDPALIGFIQRPASVQRDTYENILATEHYSINHVNAEIISQAHQTAARYDKELSEFDEVGLSSEFRDGFAAPFVKESHLSVAMKLQEIIPIELNNTKLIIGSVQAIYLPENNLLEDGCIDFSNLNSVGVTGLDTYNSFQKLKRFSYAKPNQKLSEL